MRSEQLSPATLSASVQHEIARALFWRDKHPLIKPDDRVRLTCRWLEECTDVEARRESARVFLSETFLDRLPRKAAPECAGKALVRALRDPDHVVRDLACMAIRHIRPLPSDAVSAVRRLLYDRRTLIRSSAVLAMCKICKDRSELKSALCGRLGDRSIDVRCRALEGLLKLRTSESCRWPGEFLTPYDRSAVESMAAMNYAPHYWEQSLAERLLAACN